MGYGSVVVFVVGLLVGLAAASCDGAEVGRCGSGRLVEAGGAQYCVYRGAEAARDFVCPAGFATRIELGGGIVCTARPASAEELPDAVCAELTGGCEAAPPPDAASADARAPQDAGRDAAPLDAGPIAPLEWRRVLDVEPPALRWAQLVLDPARGRAVLVGGGRSMADEVSAETWAFSFGDETWERLETSGEPPRRTGAIALLDAAADRIVVAGGAGRLSDPLIETAVALDLATLFWQPYPAPPEFRDELMAAVDTTRGVAYVAGGHHFERPFLQLWELTIASARWQTVSVQEPLPPSRGAGLLVYREGELLLVGGHGLTSLYTDAFRLRPTEPSPSWEPVPFEVEPGAPTHFAVVHDAACDRAYAFGGDRDDGEARDTVAVLDLSAPVGFAAAGALPAARRGAAAVLEPTSRKVLLFGGERAGEPLADTLVTLLPACD